MNQVKEIDWKWIGSDFGISPEQYEGTSVQARSSREFSDFDTAEMTYLKARKRFLNVNRWHRYMENASIAFRLTDQEGNDWDAQAEKKLLIRADSQEWEISTDSRCDWVEIEELEEGSTDELEYVVFRVKPCENPGDPHAGSAHFFFSAMTGTLLLHRKSLTVACTVYARNLQAYVDRLSDVTEAHKENRPFSGLPGMDWQRLIDSLWE